MNSALDKVTPLYSSFSDVGSIDWSSDNFLFFFCKFCNNSIWFSKLQTWATFVFASIEENEMQKPWIKHFVVSHKTCGSVSSLVLISKKSFSWSLSRLRKVGLVNRGVFSHPLGVLVLVLGRSTLHNNAESLDNKIGWIEIEVLPEIRQEHIFFSKILFISALIWTIGCLYQCWPSQCLY